MATQSAQGFGQATGFTVAPPPVTAPALAPVAAPAQFMLHRTIVGERWDSIAWQYYGDPTLVNPLIMANPNVPIAAVFAAGVEIAVPILRQESTPSDLPPWGTL